MVGFVGFDIHRGRGKAYSTEKSQRQRHRGRGRGVGGREVATVPGLIRAPGPGEVGRTDGAVSLVMQSGSLLGK